MATEKFEKKSFKGKLGGYRPGAGRKKGGMNKETAERKKVEKAMEARIMQQIDILLSSQFTLARGCSYLFRIETRRDKKGNSYKSKPEMVTSPEMIEQYLAGELEDSEDEYYYITTEKPDNLAINSLVDRVFGKPKQKVVGGDEDEEPIHLIIDE